jgi:hypothetical protein
MTYEQFHTLKVGDKVAMKNGAKFRTVMSIWNDRNVSGAVFAYLSPIQGCTKMVHNMVGSDDNSSTNYGNAILKMSE